jgi:hypothetical protein
MIDRVQSWPGLEDAFSAAVRIPRECRLVAAKLIERKISWWGGHIDDWNPDVERLNSPISLHPYWELRAQFEGEEIQHGSAIIVYPDDTYDIVMFGLKDISEAAKLIECVCETIRQKRLH